MRRGLIALAVCAPFAAAAGGFDAGGLARFDAGYARCEARFAPMKGTRDEAYLAIYRVKADEAGRKRLAALRREPDYGKELRRAQAATAKAAASAASASSPLDQQCRALWGEVQRARGAGRASPHSVNRP